MLGLGEALQVILCVKQDVFAEFPQILLHCPLQTKHRSFVLASRWGQCEMTILGISTVIMSYRAKHRKNTLVRVV